MRKITILGLVLGLVFSSCEKDNDDNDNQNSQDSTLVDTIGNDSTDNSNDTSQNSNNQIIDLDGNEYTSVVIGNQIWMAQNLSTTKYNDGTLIINVTEDSTWESLNSPAWCWLYNDGYYDKDYGKLYNWYAVDNARNICPVGWHVPSEDEWDEMENYIKNNGHPLSVGSALKTNYDWPEAGAGTNDFGFNATPSGEREYDGDFESYHAYWWTSSEGDTKSASYRTLYEAFDDLYDYSGDKRSGYSVRCIKD